MNNTLESLASKQEEYQTMSNEFLVNQQNQTNIIQENIQQLKGNVHKTLTTYQIEQEEEIKNYENLMQQQSENLQKVFVYFDLFDFYLHIYDFIYDFKLNIILDIKWITW